MSLTVEKVFQEEEDSKGKDPEEKACWAGSRMVSLSKWRVAGDGREDDLFTLREMIQHWSVLSRGMTRSGMHFNWSTLTVVQRIHFKECISYHLLCNDSKA